MSARAAVRTALFALATITTALTAVSCQRPIEPGVFIVVRSNIADVQRVRVQLSRDGRPSEGGTIYFDSIFPVRRQSPDIVGSLAVRAPVDRADTPLFVIATAIVHDRDAVTQRALVTFDPQRQQRLTMFLAAECEGFAGCSAAQTCTVGQRCVDERIPSLPLVAQDASADSEPLLTFGDATGMDAADVAPAPDVLDDRDATPDADVVDAMDAASIDAMDSSSPIDVIDGSDATARDDAAMDADAADAPIDSGADVEVARPFRGVGVQFGARHACGHRGYEAYCWGHRSHGQIGDGVIADDVARVTRLAGEFHRFALGTQHTCALIGSTVWCWGDASHGALGRAGAVTTATPAMADGPFDSATQIAAAGWATCGARGDGMGLYWCWGDNRAGQLGVTGASVVASPRRAFDRTLSSSLALPTWMGIGTTCVPSGNVPWLRCTGSNDRGQLGAPTPASISDLTAVPNTSGFLSNGGMGRAHGCVLDLGTRRPHCWGDNSALQCGRAPIDGSSSATYAPIDDTRADWEEIVAGATVSCGRTATREVFCWGDNELGQLGTGSLSPARSATPLRVALPEEALGLVSSADANVVCAYGSSLRLWCWGDNRWGQLGRLPRAAGVAEPTPTPIELGL